MKIILEEYPDVRLAIAGRRTSHTLDLMKLSKKLGIEDKISFIGEVHGKDLTLLYSEAAVYAFPPPQEDFGLGPIEAMACMTPVVAWDYAGPKETIVNGVTGYKAKPYDLTDFAEKILKILENPDLRAKLGKSAIAHVLKKFTWEKHTDTLIRILRRLTN